MHSVCHDVLGHLLQARGLQGLFIVFFKIKNKTKCIPCVMMSSDICSKLEACKVFSFISFYFLFYFSTNICSKLEGCKVLRD